jgi:hypothetical protein
MTHATDTGQGMTGELRWRHGEVGRLGIVEPRIAERISGGHSPPEAR